MSKRYRYEVTARGELAFDGTPWDGLDNPDGNFRTRWLPLAELVWGLHIVVPSVHPCWKWDTYDHEREIWLSDGQPIDPRTYRDEASA